MSNFCDRLREERTRLGLNQQEFGLLGGVKKHSQLNYESGERSPSVEYLVMLYEAKIDVIYLITGKRDQMTLAPDESIVVEGYRKLDGHGKAGVLALISGVTKNLGIQNNFAGHVGQVIDGGFVGNPTFNFPTDKKGD